jgi:hypothetical protein
MASMNPATQREIDRLTAIAGRCDQRVKEMQDEMHQSQLKIASLLARSGELMRRAAELLSGEHAED